MTRCWSTFSVVQIVGRHRVFRAFLIGMISCGITRTALLLHLFIFFYLEEFSIRRVRAYHELLVLQRIHMDALFRWIIFSKFWSEKVRQTISHQKRAANNGDSQASRSLLSMRFGFLLYRAREQWGSRLAHKISWKRWDLVDMLADDFKKNILPLCRFLKAPAFGGPVICALGLLDLIVNPSVSIPPVNYFQINDWCAHSKNLMRRES